MKLQIFGILSKRFPNKLYSLQKHLERKYFQIDNTIFKSFLARLQNWNYSVFSLLFF